MVVVADVVVPADEFELGQIFDSFPDIEIEIERIIPLESGIKPLFWVAGADPATVVDTLRETRYARSVDLLTDADDRALVSIDWSPKIDHFLDPLVVHDGDVLRAEGDVERWEFRIQFHDRSALRAFRDDCVERELQIEVIRIYNPHAPEEEVLLTDPQWDALIAAHEGGYWRIPRQTTVNEIAEQLGISSQATSERLRRATNSLVDAYVSTSADEGE